MTPCDIAFIGHVCYDEVQFFEGPARLAPGSAVLCGALVAARVGRQVAVVTRLAKADTHILDPLIAAGIDTNFTLAEETTYIKVIHPSADVDLRRLLQVRSAGQFRLEDVPALAAPSVHLAGISDQEFTLEFIAGLRSQGQSLSADMQSFVRQRDPATHEIFFRDVPHKRAIMPLLSQVKLDVVEAEVLTGTRNLELAARTIESWGCPEVVITQADGALAYAHGQTLYESFTNRSVVGRTGRGDTLFGAYLAWRLDHSPAESLKFATALTSIKMESTGPFQGNLAEVRRRMQRGTRITAPLDEDITARP